MQTYRLIYCTYLNIPTYFSKEPG